MRKITISPKKVVRTLLLTVLFLSVCFIIGQISRHVFGHGSLKGFVPLFDLNQEANIPTWYSSLVLFFCSVLLFVVASLIKNSNGEYVTHWRLLALVFLCLSIDEACGIHEMATVPLRDALQVSGLLHHTWIIVGLGFMIVFLVVFIPFLMHLPKRTFYLFVLAGFIFVSGAIGIESIGGNYLGRAEQVGANDSVAWEIEPDLLYSGIYFVEELLEMLGIVLFVYSVLDYANTHLGGISINFIQKADKSLSRVE